MIDINDFVKVDYGWELNQTGKFFLGKPVEVHIDTTIDSEQPDRAIFDEQVATLKLIDTNWEELAVIIEKEILTYEGLTKDELQNVLDAPRIWLGMDDEADRPWENNRWSFVLGVTESEDFGWHVEFEGKTHVETWAGG